MTLFGQERFKEALLVFLSLVEERLVRKNPQAMVIILTNLGGIYFKLQDYQKSVNCYLEALKKTKGYPSLQEKKREDKKGNGFRLNSKTGHYGQAGKRSKVV